MTHWAESYLGRTYVEDEYDCGDLVRDVMLEKFGQSIVLPARARGVRGRDAQMRAMTETLADPTDRPLEGDLVMMRTKGRRGLGHHAGVYCTIGGRAHVLHLRPIGTCLHPVDALERHGIELMGFHKWR